MNINIYTDGSSLNNPGRGGWAYAIVDNSGKLLTEDSGNENNVTNNQMELKAFAMGLIAGLNDPRTTSIDIYSDSKYVVDSINKGWAENWIKTNQTSRPNFATWKTLMEWIKYAQGRVHLRIHWVKAHDVNEWNNHVDELARKRASEL